MQKALFFLLATLSLSITATASGPSCGSVFEPSAASTNQTRQAEQQQQAFQLGIQELIMQQGFVINTMKSAGSIKNNRKFNEAMLDVTEVLNRMFDEYLFTLQIAQVHMNQGNKDSFFGLLKQNEDFFTSFLGLSPKALGNLLKIRAEVLHLEAQGNPAAMESIGFIQNSSQAAGTSPMASIGFIQNPHQGQGARALETIGFIQPPPGGGDHQAPANKLPTIGFVPPQEPTGTGSNYQRPQADVGYRLNIVFNLKFGFFEVIRPEKN